MKKLTFPNRGGRTNSGRLTGSNSGDTSRQEVIVLLLDGVARIARATKSLADDQWDIPICGQWSAQELARHLLAQSRNHHHWLDNAISGDASPAYKLAEVDEQNESAIQLLCDVPGPEAIQEFVRTAGRYANRVASHWDDPMGFDGGTATAGQHCALVALEYHLHAWDLAQPSDPGYRPQRLRQLLTVVRAAQASQTSGARRILFGASSKFHPRYRTWKYLLSQSGRPGQPSEDRQLETEPSHVIDLRSDGELALPATDRSSVPSD